MNRILIGPHELTALGQVVLTGERALHILNVLRTPLGGGVRVGVWDGPLGNAVVVSAANNSVSLQCLWEDTPPVPPMDLLLAVPRPKVLKRLWAQLSALGVHQVMLTNAVRVERNYFDTHWLVEHHYRPLLLEGLQQAGDTRIPVVSVHKSFKRAVEAEVAARCANTQRWVAHPHGGSALHSAPLEHPRVLMAVGPEGGWSGHELEMLEAHGFSKVSLGPRILRTDTACVSLLSQGHARLAQLEGVGNE